MGDYFGSDRNITPFFIFFIILHIVLKIILYLHKQKNQS